jgi:hypothetical protein
MPFVNIEWVSGQSEDLVHQRAVPVQQVTHPVRVQAVLRGQSIHLVDQGVVTVSTEQRHLVGDGRGDPPAQVTRGRVDGVGGLAEPTSPVVRFPSDGAGR